MIENIESMTQEISAKLLHAVANLIERGEVKVDRLNIRFGTTPDRIDFFSNNFSQKYTHFDCVELNYYDPNHAVMSEVARLTHEDQDNTQKE